MARSARQVARGEIRWVTVLSQDATGAPADPSTVARWRADFPDDNVIVVADEEERLARWGRVYGFPTLMLLEGDLSLARFEPGYDGVLTAISQD